MASSICQCSIQNALTRDSTRAGTLLLHFLDFERTAYAKLLSKVEKCTVTNQADFFATPLPQRASVAKAKPISTRLEVEPKSQPNLAFVDGTHNAQEVRIGNII